MKIHQSGEIMALILDMDGVLWRGSQPIGDLPAIFRQIQSLGLQVTLATNNATKTPEGHLEKVRSYGVELSPHQVVSSSQAAADYLQQRFPGGGRVYVVGEPPLAQALAEAGYLPADEGVMAVVAGLDRSFTYDKLSRATVLIRHGAAFIGTNPDLTFPTPGGLVPGAGSILAAIEAASGVKPVIVGKPSPRMYEIALKRMGVAPENTLVIGDRLETDISGAQAIGCRSAVVLSGVSTIEQVNAWKPAPDWIADDLASLLASLSGERLEH